MKTKAEVTRHLGENGYKNKDMERITAFLIGAGVKGFGEFVTIKKGKGRFKDFYLWYTKEDNSETDKKGGVISSITILI